MPLNFFYPGKPTDKTLIGSCDLSCQDECLNRNWFLSLDDAEKKVDSWRWDYNVTRSHSSPDNLPPTPFLKAYSRSRKILNTACPRCG
ncbi:MAG: hypothetical protein CSA26_08720 [Desulfobacterales bacterium]|nr:MAG: hypothetical protein CSA26_08720 [Desulfobacterales bacterium]